jgi:hypothetical protein
VLAASIIRAMTHRISDTSVNFYQTARRNNPEDSHLHTHRRENLKSHMETILFLRDVGICLQVHGIASQKTNIHFVSSLGRSPTEATRLRFDQEKKITLQSRTGRTFIS